MGLIEVGSKPLNGEWKILRLTPSGHDFLERDQNTEPAMPVLKEPAQITLAEGLTLLERRLPTEEAKPRLREAFIRKVFLQSPSYAFEYDEADIDWTTGSVKIPRMKDRFRPTFRRADFDRYFFEEQKVQPTKSGRDRKLLRELMLRLQDILLPGATNVLSGDDKEMALEGYTPEQINHHLSLLAQMGCLDLAKSQPAIGVALKGRTPKGYDFLEQNQDGLEETPYPSVKAQLSRKVFIVCGHEGEPREAVAGFLRKIGFTPVILHEQSNQGRTIVEKFEDHAEVDFAVVLLTPDDVGGPKDGAQQPRARQNVILELGYFIGKLSRKNVCAIKLGDLEIPSDILGVVWLAFDAYGAWKSALARELEDAGHAIDWNKAMRP